MTMPIGGSKGLDHVPSQFSLRDILTVVFKRRWLIVIFALSVFLLVMTVSLLLPRTYEVTATLLVNKMRVEVPMAPSEVPQRISRVSDQDLNTEIEMLKSRGLIEETVSALGVEEPPKPDTRWATRMMESIRRILGSQQLSSADGMVVRLLGQLRVSAVRRSNLIRISYVSQDPVWATRVVSTMTEKYLERRVEVFQGPQAVSFFEGQMREAEQQLTHYENAIKGFAEDSVITLVIGPEGEDPLAAQKALMMERHAQLEASLGDAHVQVLEQSREVAAIRAQLADEPVRLQTADRTNITAAAEEIEVALAALRLRRDKLLQDFRPDSRYVRDIDGQINMAEERLKQINDDSAGISGTEENPVYIQLRSELVRAETELEGTRARESALQAQLLESRKGLDKISARAFELNGLRRNALVAEDNFLLYRKKHEEARISAAMDQERFVNVTVAQPAQIPLQPLPRGLMTRLFAALVMGIFGGLGVAFGIEFYLNRSFTTGEDIERKLGIPHIASIPEMDAVG
jgi:succinoglycan biosynthesis transport protein ExoP